MVRSKLGGDPHLSDTSVVTVVVVYWCGQQAMVPAAATDAADATDAAALSDVWGMTTSCSTFLDK